MEKESKTQSKKKLWGDYDTEEEDDEKQKAEKKSENNKKSNKKQNKNNANYKMMDDAAEQG